MTAGNLTQAVATPDGGYFLLGTQAFSQPAYAGRIWVIAPTKFQPIQDTGAFASCP